MNYLPLYLFLGAVLFDFVIEHFVKNALRAEGYPYYYLFGRYKNMRNLSELAKDNRKRSTGNYSKLFALYITAYLIFITTGIYLIFHYVQD